MVCIAQSYMMRPVFAAADQKLPEILQRKITLCVAIGHLLYSQPSELNSFLEAVRVLECSSSKAIILIRNNRKRINPFPETKKDPCQLPKNAQKHEQ